jgi:hypothetical protein
MRWYASLFGVLVACTSATSSVPSDAGPEASDWKPAKASWEPGDLHDIACRRAAQLGCLDASQVGSCATTLAKQTGKLWEMRMMTVAQAQNRRHIRDSTVIPCDAGRDEDWDGDGEAPPAWRARRPGVGVP